MVTRQQKQYLAVGTGSFLAFGFLSNFTNKNSFPSASMMLLLSESPRSERSDVDDHGFKDHEGGGCW